MDVSSLIKRIRFSYNTMTKLTDKEMKKYLYFNQTNIVNMSDSDDDFDYNVEKGYFSSSSSDPD